MSRESQDFHGKFLNFTCEYLCVTTRELSRMSEVVVERYRILITQVILTAHNEIVLVLLTFTASCLCNDIADNVVRTVCSGPSTAPCICNATTGSCKVSVYFIFKCV